MTLSKVMVIFYPCFNELTLKLSSLEIYGIWEGTKLLGTSTEEYGTEIPIDSYLHGVDWEKAVIYMKSTDSFVIMYPNEEHLVTVGEGIYTYLITDGLLVP